MAYTEKVLLSGTALSFLLYECINSGYSQEGFLVGDITSQVTNHISDSQSDNARLDTQIIIRTVLPVPSVSLFYFPTGRIKEEALTDLLSHTAKEIVGWYKYRKNNNIKPTFRDKLIAKGLQKYFEKNHGKKTFVTCNLSNRTSSVVSTHTYTYRFGKVNCYDMYEYIEDVTENLGEKYVGYKRAPQLPTNCVFNNIVNETNGQHRNEAILHIQEVVDERLKKEAKLAAKNENVIRELQAEIKQMTSILTDKQSVELYAAYSNMMEEEAKKQKADMARACAVALRTPQLLDMMTINNLKNMTSATMETTDGEALAVDEVSNDRSSSSCLITTTPTLNYAAALKNKNDQPSTSKENKISEDLITFDVDKTEDKRMKKTILLNNDGKCFDDSSPEY